MFSSSALLKRVHSACMPPTLYWDLTAEMTILGMRRNEKKTVSNIYILIKFDLVWYFLFVYIMYIKKILNF